MTDNTEINNFLCQYSEDVIGNALQIRKMILDALPDVQEQLDTPAKMVAYCYGQKYTEMVCTLIPSKKGLKLGFYKGMDLPDPESLLKGEGKLSRYVEMNKQEDIQPKAIKALLKEAYKAYKIRNSK